MKQMDFARIIKALRDKYGWTQEVMAERLNYSASNISRIEAGQLVPPILIIESALQLLGEDSQELLVFFSSAAEKLGYKTMHELDHLYVKRDYEGMRKLLATVEGKKPFTSGLFLQHLAFCKAVSDEALTVQERLDLLMDAMRITQKDYEPEATETSIFTYNEIAIVGEIASAYHHLGDNEKAVRIMYGLKKSLNKGYWDEKEKSRTYPMVLYNLSVYLGALERNDEMYEACVEAKRCAIKYNNMRVLPKVLAVIAHYHFLKEDYIGYKDTLLQAYFAARGMEQYALANRIASVAKERYNLDLEAVISSL